MVDLFKQTTQVPKTWTLENDQSSFYDHVAAICKKLVIKIKRNLHLKEQLLTYV